jgi:hypothetical protein
MTFEQTKSIIQIFSPLVGKSFESKIIISVFTAPYQRDPKLMIEMMDNIMEERMHLNEEIILKHEYFDVFVLFINNIDNSRTVTPVDEVLRSLINTYLI